MVQNATVNMFPSMFPYQVDMNSGNSIGVGYMQQSVGNGRRSSSSTSYLAPQVLARPNLAVLVNAEVIKLVKARLYFNIDRHRPEFLFDNRQVYPKEYHTSALFTSSTTRRHMLFVLERRFSCRECSLIAALESSTDLVLGQDRSTHPNY
jgi:hypothetical protein